MQVVVNISEAARIASKTRRTIYKHINQGKLSTSRDSKGNKGIELTELIRVYGDDVRPPGSTKKEGGIHAGGASVSNSEKIDLLLKKIESLENEVCRLNDTVENLNRLEYKPIAIDAEEPVLTRGNRNSGTSSIIARLKNKL